MKKEIDFEEAKTTIMFTEGNNGSITNMVVKGNENDILTGIFMILIEMSNSKGMKASELAEMIYQGTLTLERLGLPQNERSKDHEN